MVGSPRPQNIERKSLYPRPLTSHQQNQQPRTAQPKPPQHPKAHSYYPGKNLMELIATPSGPMERWRAVALLLGETSAAIQARHDAVTKMLGRSRATKNANLRLDKRHSPLNEPHSTQKDVRSLIKPPHSLVACQSTGTVSRRSKQIKSANRKNPSTSYHESGVRNWSHRWHWKTLCPASHLRPHRRKTKTRSGKFLREVPEFRMPVAAGFDSR